MPAVAAFVVVGAVSPWSDGSGRRVAAIFDAVPGLVEGAEVQESGATIGRVERIGLQGERPHVVLRLHAGRRLHRGASADLRMVSLSGQLNRVVAIRDGRGAALRDGATLGLARTDQPVEVEQVLGTLDPATRRRVRRIAAGAAEAVVGRGEALAGSLRRARAALEASASTVGDLQADGAALRQVVATMSRVSTALAAAPGTTAAAADRVGALLGDTAAEQAALGRTLAALPGGLRAGRATLEHLERRVPGLRAAARDARPAVAALRTVAPEARSALAQAEPALGELRGLTTEGPRRLRALAPLVPEAAALARDGRRALDRANPMLDELRARLPDAFSFFANWADFTSSYDGNGHGARVGIVLPPAPNREASPDGQGAGSLPRPFLRSPGSLQDVPWTDFARSFTPRRSTP